jgi:hypothetical protein
MYPSDLDTLSVDTLRWDGYDLQSFPPDGKQIIESLTAFANQCIYTNNREVLFHITRDQRAKLHGQLKDTFAKSPQFAGDLGVDPNSSFEVHELRTALRARPDGSTVPQIIVALTQCREMKEVPNGAFWGGSTIVVDLSGPAIKYRILKRIDSANREARTAAFIRDTRSDPLHALMLDSQKEPFALLHSLFGGSDF